MHDKVQPVYVLNQGTSTSVSRDFKFIPYNTPTSAGGTITLHTVSAKKRFYLVYFLNGNSMGASTIFILRDGTGVTKCSIRNEADGVEHALTFPIPLEFTSHLVIADGGALIGHAGIAIGYEQDL